MLRKGFVHLKKHGLARHKTIVVGVWNDCTLYSLVRDWPAFEFASCPSIQWHTGPHIITGTLFNVTLMSWIDGFLHTLSRWPAAALLSWLTPTRNTASIHMKWRKNSTLLSFNLLFWTGFCFSMYGHFGLLRFFTQFCVGKRIHYASSQSSYKTLGLFSQQDAIIVDTYSWHD